MRKTIKDFVGIVAECLPVAEPIYEFGSLQVPEQEGWADLRPLFPGKRYVGADMREGLGVDQLLDLHAIDLPEASVGTVLCMETLEHVEYPRRAVEEIHRILAPAGFAVISSQMNFPIHDYPYDYWRFTPEAFRSLLKPFAASFVGPAGNKDFPHTVVGIGFKTAAPDLSRLKARYERWRKAQRFALIHVVQNVTPPVLLPVVKAVYRGTRRLIKRLK